MKAFGELLKSDKAIKLIVLAGVGVIIFIFIMSFVDVKSPSETKEADETSEEEYVAVIENKLRTILTEIDGVGDIHIMITLEKTEENLYSDSKNSVSAKITPVIRGCLVVSTGCENIVVREKVLEAVSKSLGIGISKVCVTY